MIKLINIKYIIIFSILIELIALFFIRLIGIDWDYHVDSVTYITFSEAVTEKVLKSKIFPLSLLNQGFYILVDFLNSSPNNIISFNILVGTIETIKGMVINIINKHKINYINKINIIFS